MPTSDYLSKVPAKAYGHTPGKSELAIKFYSIILDGMSDQVRPVSGVSLSELIEALRDYSVPHDGSMDPWSDISLEDLIVQINLFFKDKINLLSKDSTL